MPVGWWHMFGHSDELEEIARELHGICHELHEIREELRWLEHIRNELACICKALSRPQILDFTLKQINPKGVPMPITGIPVGGSGTFQIGFVPPNGVPLQSGPTVKV